MQAGIILIYLVASLLALLGRRMPAVFTFLLAVAASAWWLRHHMTDPLALAL